MNLAQWFITQTGLIREYKQDLPPNMTLRLKNKHICLLTLCLTPFLALFVFSNKVFALSDLTFTIDSSNCPSSQNLYLCSTNINQSSNLCAGYKYLMVDSDDDFGSNYDAGLNIFMGITGGISTDFGRYKPVFSAHSVYSLDNSDMTSLYVYRVSSNSCSQLGNNSITITLTENSPYEPCESCPEPEPTPEPEPVDCEYSPIVQFFKDVFLNVVTGVIPSFAIFVVVWFMVDLLSSLWFGRGK